MKVNPITMFFILLFIYPLIKGFFIKYSSQSLKEGVSSIEYNIAFILSLILGTYLTKQIFILHKDGMYKKIYELLPYSISFYVDTMPMMVYIIAVPIFIFFIYHIFKLAINGMNRVGLYPVFDSIEESVKGKSEFAKRMLGAVFQLPKSICYVLLVAFAFNIFSVFTIEKNFNRYLEQSSVYNYICTEIVIPVTNSKLAKRLPQILDQSFKVITKEVGQQDGKGGQNQKSKAVVYYNGVTLEEGIKSNEQIDRFAKSFVEQNDSNKVKARKIYTWIGTNISYDHEKAQRVLNNDFNIKSGAIPTFQSREGICFDYACLYVAMCRANGLKVRLVTGEGFNGVSWVSHAWNQVYLSDEKKWINVDATFYKGGNYFNSKRFELDHKNEEIVGEW